MIYGYENAYSYNYSSEQYTDYSYYGTFSYYRTYYSESEDWTLFYVGVGLLSIGLVFLVVGTPLMIVGWVMRHKYKKQISMFIDSDSKYSRIGLVYRF